MKSFLLKFMALSSVVLLMLSSCKKDETKAVASSSPTAGTLTASATTLNLSKTTLTSTAVTFTSASPNFGYAAAVTTTLQLAVKGTSFASPTTVALGSTTASQTYTVQDFNAMLLAMKLPAGTAAQIEARIVYTISTSTTAPIAYSNVVTVSATPFALTSWIYVVGAFQGWNASSPDSLISATSNGIYTGIINFTAGNNQFLILPAKNYNNKYATSNATGSTSTTVAYNGNNNLYAPSVAGQYVVTLNLNTNTISFALANYYSVIGSTTAGGNFTTDADLTKYVNDGATGWTGTIAMTAGEFKIRQNHDWTYSWGNISPADGKDLTSSSGGNISVAAAGNYKVTFAIPISAVGTAPSVTATYTVTKQ